MYCFIDFHTGPSFFVRRIDFKIKGVTAITYYYGPPRTLKPTVYDPFVSTGYTNYFK
jgi:hypothetical protein